MKEGINTKSQALKVAQLAGIFDIVLDLMPGLPQDTLRIAAKTLDYMEQNAVPVIHPGDEFLSSFAIDDTREPIMDTIAETHVAEEQIEELKEVVEVDDEDEDELEEQANPELQLYSRILSDNEKRKMEKVHTQAKKDAEKERKRIKKETLKAEKEREKADKKMQNMMDALKPMEMKSAESNFEVPLG